ncbi:MAG: cation:proton antiporter [Saprospiraceae bacterium]
MTSQVIITLCVLLLIAYIFDISASKTRVPSVVMLLLLGYVLQHLAVMFEVILPDMEGVLPVLGTLGLVLIVLEGSLELELNSSQFSFVRKTLISAAIPFFILSFLLAFVLVWLDGIPLKSAFTNVVPLAIISSAIAIPSAQSLDQKSREFIIYESSLSDIIGVIVFNFVALNAIIDGGAIFNFSFQLIIMLVITLLATALLAFLMGKINHHIKFGPIILIIILIYSLSKIFHLPALVFILLFGLFLRNFDEINNWKPLSFLDPKILIQEVTKLKELTSEAAFLVRTLFFLLFGFLINTDELFNLDTLPLASGIVLVILLVRWGILLLLRMPLLPILYIAPRGLITILLFLSIPIAETTSSVNKSLIIQVIILSALIMMMGMLFYKPVKAKPTAL